MNKSDHLSLSRHKKDKQYMPVFSFSLYSLVRFVIFVCIIIMMDHENVTEKNGFILGSLCSGFVPLPRFLCT